MSEMQRKGLGVTSGFSTNTPPDEVPRPPIKARCRTCRVNLTEIRADVVVVSPKGMAHIGEDYGRTFCGRDATGDNWWWPL